MHLDLCLSRSFPLARVTKNSYSESLLRYKAEAEKIRPVLAFQWLHVLLKMGVPSLLHPIYLSISINHLPGTCLIDSDVLYGWHMIQFVVYWLRKIMELYVTLIDVLIRLFQRERVQPYSLVKPLQCSDL